MTQKEKVVIHVAEMIQTLGIKSVRMDDVASSLGMSKRTLYEIFGGKEELLLESIKYISEERPRKVLAEIGPCQNSLEMLFKCSRALLDDGLVSDMDKRMALNLKKFYPEIAEKLRHLHADMAIRGLNEVLTQACKEGYIDTKVNIELMIRLFFSIMTSAVYENSLVIPKEVTREKAYGALAVNFFRGISTPKGIEVIDGLLDQWSRECEKKEAESKENR